jgi:RNA polymerase sigma-70 factor, ECF subfamily
MSLNGFLYYTLHKELKVPVPIAHSPFNDDELIRRLLARDEEAFALAIRTHQGKMLALARAMVGEAAADDVVQETWVAVLKGLPRFEGRARLETWILSILSNLAKTRLRHDTRYRHRHTSWEENSSAPEKERFDSRGFWLSPPFPWNEETPEALLANEELRQCLLKAVTTLPPAQCSVLTLHDNEGLAMEEICNILEISATNGRVLLHRARARLRAAIENHHRREC